MSVTALKRELEERIESGQYVSRNKQLKTSLNQLVKQGLVDESNIDVTFTDDDKLKNMIARYQEILIAAKKKELRSPLTHARNLAAFYRDHFAFNTDGMNFQQAFKAAFHRKYPNIYEGEITPKDRVAIKKKYTTYREIANDMARTGKEKCPSAWPKNIQGASALIVQYVHGVSTPTVSVPMERLEYFEDYFMVPRGTFINKLRKRMNWISEKRNGTKRKRKAKSVNALSPSLQKYTDEYKEFKVNGKQPKITLVPKAFIGREKHLKVIEEGRRSNTNWTYNPGRKNSSSVDMFTQNLTAFMSFCVEEQGMKPEEITLAHLTNVDILEAWKDKLMDQGWGASPLERLLNQIKRSSQPRGYLRLCGELGSRSMEEYYSELDLISALEGEWSKLLEKAKDDIDPKENIRFLMDMDPLEMWSSVNAAIQWGIDHAKNLISYPSKDYVRSAYNLIQTLMILHLSRIQPLRATNWANLHFYENQKEFNTKVPSMTWYKSKGCYRLYVPVPYLKNRSRTDIAPCDVFFPKDFNEVIDNYLKYRELYIERVINENGLHNHNPIHFMPKKHKNEPKNEFVDDGGGIGARFKVMTRLAFTHTLPEVNQNGLNHHGTRHLAATWYLNQHPGDFVGLCALLNDSLTVIIKDYAEVDQKLAKERIANAVSNQDIKFTF